MIEIRTLNEISFHDLKRLITGYRSHVRYDVSYIDTENETTFHLDRVVFPEPYIKMFDHVNEATYLRYCDDLRHGWSQGAFEAGRVVGILIAEPHHWNRSLWIWEFHVADTHRSMGIGRRLMDRAVQQARENGFRTIVCETQQTNGEAMDVYRRLEFRVEGIDVSYYTNDDHPGGEIAVFMKRRIFKD